MVAHNWLCLPTLVKLIPTLELRHSPTDVHGLTYCIHSSIDSFTSSGLELCVTLRHHPFLRTRISQWTSGWMVCANASWCRMYLWSLFRENILRGNTFISTYQASSLHSSVHWNVLIGCFESCGWCNVAFTLLPSNMRQHYNCLSLAWKKTHTWSPKYHFEGVLMVLSPPVAMETLELKNRS